MSDKIIKKCKKHGETEFFYSKSENRYRCKKCRIDAVSKRRKKIKELAIQYKGGKCIICGYNKCNGALEFHHLDQSKKDFSISKNGYTRSWKKLKEELDKCVLVCANCHREIHSGMIDIDDLKINQYFDIEEEKTKKYNICERCNKLFFLSNGKKQKYCSKKCYNKSREKIKIDKDKLQKFVFEKPLVTIAKELGISDRGLKKYCNRHNIITPKQGYWTKRNNKCV